MSDAMLDLEYAVLKVSDVTKTADYYREVLGFSVDWMFGDPPTQAGTASRLWFSRTRSLLCFRVDDLEALHSNYQASGAKIVAAPAMNEDSGHLEMEVEDGDGHLLRFVQHVTAEDGSALPDAPANDDECPCQEAQVDSG